MHRSVWTAGTVALLLIATGCDPADFGPSDRYTEDFHQTFDQKPGGRLSVESMNGSVEITGWDRSVVEISGTKYASRRELLDTMDVEMEQRGDLVEIRTIAPREFRGGNRGARFVIHVPRQTVIDRAETSNGSVQLTDLDGRARLRTSNGRVTVNRFNGDIDTRTSNGQIRIDEFVGSAILATSNGSINVAGVKGHLDAQTSNGGIDASVDEVSGARGLRLRTSNARINLTVRTDKLNDITANTSNGSITLRVPQGANAKLKAHTSNGSVNVDFPLNRVMTQKKSNVEGEIGSGGPIVDLGSSNGSIRIERY